MYRVKVINNYVEAVLPPYLVPKITSASWGQILTSSTRKKFGQSSKRIYKDDPKSWEICFPLWKQVHPTSSIKQEIKSLELDLQVHKKTLMGV